MLFINQSATLAWATQNPGFVVERAARLCYQSLSAMRCWCLSEKNIANGEFWPTKTGDLCDNCEERNLKFLRGLLRAKPTAHESVFEHACASFVLTTNRGVSHELVRHRLASYSQESTRYVCYNDEGEHPMRFIKDATYGKAVETGCASEYQRMLEDAEDNYGELLDRKFSPQTARAVLPNSLATTIQMTANAREWRHFLRLRCSAKSHPDMVDLAGKIRTHLLEWFPVLFEDC